MKMLEVKGTVKKVLRLKPKGWMVLVDRKWFYKFSGACPKLGHWVQIGFKRHSLGDYEIKYFISEGLK